MNAYRSNQLEDVNRQLREANEKLNETNQKLERANADIAARTDELKRALQINRRCQ